MCVLKLGSVLLFVDGTLTSLLQDISVKGETNGELSKTDKPCLLVMHSNATDTVIPSI